MFDSLILGFCLSISLFKSEEGRFYEVGLFPFAPYALRVFSGRAPGTGLLDANTNSSLSYGYLFSAGDLVLCVILMVLDFLCSKFFGRVEFI